MNWLDRLEPKIREQVDWIRFHRMDDYARAESICEELIDYGKLQNDHALIGACYYYIGEMNYAVMKVSEALSELELSLMYLEHSDAPRMHANACMTLGCIHMISYSYETAMDYFLRGIAISEKHHFGFTAGALYNNIAAIHVELKNYTEALDCLRLSWKNYALEQESRDFHLHCLISNRTLMAISYLRLDDLPGAEECIREIQEMLKQQSKSTWDLSSYYQLMVTYSERIGDEEQLMKYLDLFQATYNDSVAKTDLASTVVLLLEDLYNRNRLELLKILEPLIRELMQADIPPNLRMTLLKVCWNLLEDKQSEEALALVPQIFDTYDQLNAYENRTKNGAVHKLLHRNAMYQQAEEWMMMANNDTLTGLWNRRYFDSLFKDMRSTAAAQGETIAVGIMDIDFFKQFNDNYGHLEGDNCLKQVADLLKKHAGERLAFARYGGDEFLLLARGMSEEELRQEMTGIYQELAEANLPHLYSEAAPHVTMSLGISFYRDATQMGDSVADLLSEADRLLYRVKENGKDAFLIEVR